VAVYDYRTITKDEVNALMKPLEEKEEVTISAHHDADGITTGVLTSYRLPNTKQVFPKGFGRVQGPVDIMCDMHPNKYTMPLVIDHHPVPEDVEIPNTTNIIHGEEPASLVAWTVFKDYIPKEHWWKVAVGLNGDGQPELIPNEVWDQSRCLLDEHGKFGWSVAKKRNEYRAWPVWGSLSSAINAFCRVDWPVKAFEILKEANTPYDILNNPLVEEYKKKVFSETVRLEKNYKPINLSRLLYWKVSTPYSLTGTLASKLYDLQNKTVFVLNTENNAISIRGILAYYIREKIEHLIDGGGHPGFVGASVKKGVTEGQILEALRGI